MTSRKKDCCPPGCTIAVVVAAMQSLPPTLIQIYRTFVLLVIHFSTIVSYSLLFPRLNQGSRLVCNGWTGVERLLAQRRVEHGKEVYVMLLLVLSMAPAIDLRLVV